MPTRVVWSNKAQQDLLDIYVAIGLDNPRAAERLYDRLKSRAFQLADHPRMGPRRADIGLEVRVLVESPYLILYQTHPDADQSPISLVELVSVVDGRRDPETIRPV